MWLLISFAVLGLAWSVFGKLDVVAVAQGKIIPNNEIKLIQSLEAGNVKRILVQDGQYVREGERLIELDDTQVRADLERLSKENESLSLQLARYDAFLDRLNGKESPFQAVSSTVLKFEEARTLLNAEWADYTAKLSRIDAVIAQREAELSETLEIIKK